MTEMPVLIGSGEVHAEHASSEDEQVRFLFDETLPRGQYEVSEYAAGSTMTPGVASSSSLSDTERPSHNFVSSSSSMVYSQYIPNISGLARINEDNTDITSAWIRRICEAIDI